MLCPPFLHQNHQKSTLKFVKNSIYLYFHHKSNRQSIVFINLQFLNLIFSQQSLLELLSHIVCLLKDINRMEKPSINKKSLYQKLKGFGLLQQERNIQICFCAFQRQQSIYQIFKKILNALQYQFQIDDHQYIKILQCFMESEQLFYFKGVELIQACIIYQIKITFKFSTPIPTMLKAVQSIFNKDQISVENCVEKIAKNHLKQSQQWIKKNKNKIQNFDKRVTMNYLQYIEKIRRGIKQKDKTQSENFQVRIQGLKQKISSQQHQISSRSRIIKLIKEKGKLIQNIQKDDSADKIQELISSVMPLNYGLTINIIRPKEFNQQQVKPFVSFRDDLIKKLSQIMILKHQAFNEFQETLFLQRQNKASIQMLVKAQDIKRKYQQQIDEQKNKFIKFISNNINRLQQLVICIKNQRHIDKDWLNILDRVLQKSTIIFRSDEALLKQLDKLQENTDINVEFELQKLKQGQQIQKISSQYSIFLQQLNSNLFKPLHQKLDSLFEDIKQQQQQVQKEGIYNLTYKYVQILNYFLQYDQMQLKKNFFQQVAGKKYKIHFQAIKNIMPNIETKVRQYCYQIIHGQKIYKLDKRQIFQFKNIANILYQLLRFKNLDTLFQAQGLNLKQLIEEIKKKLTKLPKQIISLINNNNSDIQQSINNLFSLKKQVDELKLFNQIKLIQKLDFTQVDTKIIEKIINDEAKVIQKFTNILFSEKPIDLAEIKRLYNIIFEDNIEQKDRLKEKIQVILERYEQKITKQLESLERGLTKSIHGKNGNQIDKIHNHLTKLQQISIIYERHQQFTNLLKQLNKTPSLLKNHESKISLIIRKVYQQGKIMYSKQKLQQTVKAIQKAQDLIKQTNLCYYNIYYKQIKNKEDKKEEEGIFFTGNKFSQRILYYFIVNDKANIQQLIYLPCFLGIYQKIVGFAKIKFDQKIQKFIHNKHKLFKLSFALPDLEKQKIEKEFNLMSNKLPKQKKDLFLNKLSRSKAINKKANQLKILRNIATNTNNIFQSVQKFFESSDFETQKIWKSKSEENLKILIQQLFNNQIKQSFMKYSQFFGLQNQKIVQKIKQSALRFFFRRKQNYLVDNKLIPLINTYINQVNNARYQIQYLKSSAKKCEQLNELYFSVLENDYQGFCVSKKEQVRQYLKKFIQKNYLRIKQLVSESENNKMLDEIQILYKNIFQWKLAVNFMNSFLQKAQKSIKNSKEKYQFAKETQRLLLMIKNNKNNLRKLFEKVSRLLQQVNSIEFYDDSMKLLNFTSLLQYIKGKVINPLKLLQYCQDYYNNHLCQSQQQQYSNEIIQQKIQGKWLKCISITKENIKALKIDFQEQQYLFKINIVINLAQIVFKNEWKMIDKNLEAKQSLQTHLRQKFTVIWEQLNNYLLKLEQISNESANRIMESTNIAEFIKQNVVVSLVFIKKIICYLGWKSQENREKLYLFVNKISSAKNINQILYRELNNSKSIYALIIAAQSPIFKRHSSLELKNKTSRQDIKYIIENCPQLKADKQLSSNIRQFWGVYQDVYNKIDNQFKKNCSQQYIKAIIYQLNNIQKSQNNNSNMANIIAKILGVWSLTKFHGQNIFQPHPAQIISIYLLVGNHDLHNKKRSLVQLLIGQDKSVILAVACIYLALKGYHLFYAFRDKKFSNKDCNQLEGLFKLFNVQSQIKYGSLQQHCESIIFDRSQAKRFRQHFNAILSSKRIQKAAFEHFSKVFDSKLHDLNKILIVDQVEAFFDEEFFGKLYYDYLDYDLTKQLIEYIWKKTKSSRQNDKISRVTKQAVFQSEQFKKITMKYPAILEFLERQVIEMLQAVYSYDHQQYVICDKSIKYLKNGSITNTINYVYKTVFAYCQQCQRKTVSQLSYQSNLKIIFKISSFCYLQLAKLFQSILAVGFQQISSNKLGILRDKYNFTGIYSIPSIFGNISKPQQSFSVINDSQFYNKIIEEAGKFLSSDRPIALIFKCRKDALSFYSSSQFKKFTKITVFSTEQKEQKQELKKIVLQPKKITILLQNFILNAEYKIFNKSQNHLIQTFVSSNQSQFLQIKGKFFKQAYSGSIQVLVKQTEIKKLFQICPKNTQLKGKIESLWKKNLQNELKILKQRQQCAKKKHLQTQFILTNNVSEKLLIQFINSQNNILNSSLKY